MRRRAFSLIEVMISSALFLVGLTAVFTCYHTGVNLVEHHRKLTTAIAINEGTLEELVQRYPGDPLLDVGPHPSGGARHYDESGRLAAAGAGGFDVTWDVKLYAKLAGVREVTVSVAWQERGEPKTFSLTTWRL